MLPSGKSGLSGTGTKPGTGSMTITPGMVTGSVVTLRTPLSGLSRSSRVGLSRDSVTTVTLPPSGVSRLQT
ncbi:Hypothetical protein AA314_09738 [Archangium gephyra]|uniref:Uncharacterized protein n=1 Tax=Archangium gephyra TaxID=48 RepID=A0AAC8TJ73_9BACT|nr:Hypothetical protein AA314_09738 [Archangium gephyra]